MNTTFLTAALQNMEPQLVRACALWAALRVSEHELPGYMVEVGLADALLSFECNEPASALSLRAALDESCPSAVRSAIFSLYVENFRLHAHHALVELAKQQGLHLVNNMLSDLLESDASPLEVAV